MSIVDFGKVGSLFCPVLFDLGETMSVAVVSVTEGVGKLAKYPHMFEGSYLIVPNKVECRAFATGNAVSSGVPRS